MITKQQRIEPSHDGPVTIQGRKPYAMIARYLALESSSRFLISGGLESMPQLKPTVRDIFTSDDVDSVAVRYYNGDHENALYWLQSAIDIAVIMTRNGVKLDQ